MMFRSAILALVISAALAATVITTRGSEQPAPGNVWEPVSQSAPAPGRSFRGPFALARLNKAAFDALVSTAPAEGSPSAAATVITLPMPDGSFNRFTVVDSPIIATELAAQFPEIRTFAGQGIDDPTATVRFGWTAAGFHAIILSAAGTIFIDPYSPSATDLYVAVGKAGIERPSDPFICLLPNGGPAADRSLDFSRISNGTTLRTYRLALAADGEYTVAAGSVSNALARMVATMNRVNGIYERELAIRMTMSTGPGGNPTQLIYPDAGTDPYSNADPAAMLAQNQTNLDTVMGTANYDIGHVFGIGGGGVAFTPSTCISNLKAQGVTQSQNPVGDAFDVDYVAHEIGHQFGGNHTFNGLSGSCSGARSGSHATEVGSGSTIMAYAGICDPENLQPHSDDYFTYESLFELQSYITSGTGSTCGTTSSTGNSVPSVSAGSNYTIPIGTPFVLTATGSDPNGDSLTFDWEEHDFGTASTSVADASTDNGSRPILRSYAPVASPARTLPALTYVLNNGNVPPQTYSCGGPTCLTGEVLPATDRTMTFFVTVRDNRSGGGAINTASMTVTSTTTAGPFVVTAPNSAISVSGGASLNVTWNVANTSSAPVSVGNVRILLSTNGGASFPTVLAASTPNDGAQMVIIPNSSTTTARIKVEAVGGIFFDLSNTNFTINATPLTFTDNPLVAGTTFIKAVHVTELRDYVNTLRTRVGLSTATWTDASLVVGTTMIKAVHITELRQRLNEVYVQLALTPPTYSTTVIVGSTVRTADINDLRNAIQAIW